MPGGGFPGVVTVSEYNDIRDIWRELERSKKGCR
jgi:hypothetical protein